MIETKWTQAARDAYYAEHPENFADPKNKAYPIKDANDVKDAWNLAGHAANPDAVRSKIKSIAARLGLTSALPDTAKDGKKEASSEATNRIARVKSVFLEDDTTSLNGRKYPAQTVNRLIQAAQVQLSDPNALPLTVYLSHNAAFDDATQEIVGKVAAIGKEGTQAFALIDVPDTQAGREVVNLVKGGYIKSQSLRAVNAEMYIDQNEPYPLVGGENIRLTGIDFTSSPGIPNARVEYVSESSEFKEPQNIREIFHTSKDTLLIEELSTTHQESKDIPASPETKEPLMTEEEKAQLLKEFRETLLAEQQAQQKETEKQQDPPKPTAEDALKLLQEAGYTVQAPKTQEQLMQEALDAKLSSMQTSVEQKLTEMQSVFEQKAVEMQQKFNPRFIPQRKSMVEGSNADEKPAKKNYYRNGDYMREKMRDVNARLELMDRSRPKPEWYNAERFLKELEIELMGWMDAQHSFDNKLEVGEV